MHTRPEGASILASMAAGTPYAPSGEESPPVDPKAIDRAFVRHRARRVARVEHYRELKRARRRFWALFGGLVLLTVVLSVTILEQIRTLFGI